MLQVFIALMSVYFFVGIGFAAKKMYPTEMSERTIARISLYFLQPILTLWGMVVRPLDTRFLLTGSVFLAVLITCFTLLPLLLKRLNLDPKDKAVVLTASLLGSTANMGIPIGLVLFGEASLPYTVITNFANLLMLSTFGVYSYSRGSSSFVKSLKNIITMPVLWAMLIGFSVNLLSIELPAYILNILSQGGNTAIVLQSIVFGMYISSLKIEHVKSVILIPSFTIKYLLLPALGLFVSYIFQFSLLIQAIILLQFMMPVAINNITLSTIYDCHPSVVAELSFLSFLASVFIVPIGFLFFV